MKKRNCFKFSGILSPMRYHRQELFIGQEAQKRLRTSHAVIVGVGALGTVAAELLVRAGIGRLTLIDRDIIEESNLQRQSLFLTEDIGKSKAALAKKRLVQINSEIIIDAYAVDLDEKDTTLLEGDVILDGTDNMYTRFVINDYAKKYAIPFVFCAAVGNKGMIYTVKDACLQCFLQ